MPVALLRQDMRQYNHVVNFYNRAQTIPVVRGCFAFMFTNLGDVIARVNGMVIFPSATPAIALGDSRTISGHLLDIFVGNIDLAFVQPTAGIAPNVEIVQLYYVTAD